MERKKWKNKNLWTAFKHSLDGIKYTFQEEVSLKIQFVIAILAITLAVFFKLSIIKFAILFIAIGFVLFAELINTSIEVMLDLYSQEYNEKIKLAKDIASGAVLVTAIISIAIGISLFLPEILNKLGEM